MIIRRDRRYYALANKILGIESYCNEGDVIVDVDADDFVIGAYGLQVLEYLYKRD